MAAGRWIGGGLAATLLGGVAFAEVAVPPVPPAPAKPPFASPQDAIVARQDAYKASGKIFKAMKDANDAGQDPAPFAADARWLSDWGRQIPQMFPDGSQTGHKTQALPAIWSDKAGFDKDALAYSAAAAKLAEVAATGDKAAFVAQWKATGQTCGTCHRSFREKTE